MRPRRQRASLLGKVTLAGMSLLALLGSQAGARSNAPAPQRPNILIIVADDLGYSDIGSFGSEIRTPNLDRLARSGVRLTNFHTYAACSPTRAALLTGASPHNAGFGTMAGDWTPQTEGKRGYEAVLTHRVATIAEILGRAGYRTMLSGKWDMGGARDPAYRPAARGFQQHFALIQGAGAHFDNKGVFPDIPTVNYVENGKDTLPPPNFFSSKTFADKLIGYLGQGDQSKPFFAMLNFTAPHWPLQAPDEDIARQRGRYAKGYEAIHAARLSRQRQLGLIGRSQIAAPFDPDWPSWQQLSPELRQLEERRMEIYAAMVSNLDQQVGRVIAALRAKGQLENTVIIFMSDNGADGGNPLDFGGPDWYRWAAQERDLRLDQMGGRNSYVWYGPQWAHVGSTPFRLGKGFATEGGTRVPFIAAGPGIKHRNRLNGAFTQVLDIVPTVLDYAGVPIPNGQFEGRPIERLEGTSLKPLLANPSLPALHPADAFFGWELWARRAGRQGDWKIVWQNPPWGPKERWALYNVATDPAEQHDLSESRPEVARALIARWDEWARQQGVVPIPYFPSDWSNVRTHFDWRPAGDIQKVQQEINRK
jgi:arylsulfatase A-like enzyme